MMPVRKITVDREIIERFLDIRFSRTAANSQELEEEKKAYREETKKEYDKQRKQFGRDREKELKSLSVIRKDITDARYQNICKKIHKNYDKKMTDLKKNQTPASQTLLKGKGKIDFNIFIDSCYCLFKKHLLYKDAQIYRWIKDFLEKENIEYGTELIRSRVNDFKKKDPERFGNLIDWIFQKFIAKQKR